MPSKFGRSYRLVIDPKDGLAPIVITMPITVQFDTNSNIMSSTNVMNIDIYNLGKENRDRIFQDRFTLREREITLEAGYDSLSMLFKGNIFQAGSAREGTDIITRIEARTGIFDIGETTIFETLSKGQTLGSVFDYLIGKFPNLEKGAVGTFDDNITRPVVMNGNLYNLLKKYSNNKVFIDNNKVFVLNENEVIEGELPRLDIATGLLGTPMREDGFLSVNTLFEPRVKMKQVIELKSKILPVYDGKYAVIGVQHQGTISEAMSGQLSSTFSLFVGSSTFKIVNEG